MLADENTIIAQCTPRGSGAIALLRMSGKDAFALVTAIGKIPGGLIADQQSHTIRYGSVIDSAGKPIDQVLFMLMRGPRTFTGEDTVEITCHNNQFIVEAIIEQVLLNGARIAQEGEFTRRAVAHGKIDLLQAEAINELISAQTSLGIKKALSQLEGSFSYFIADIEQDIVKVIAWCEASFEFLDEERDFTDEIKARLENVVQKIQRVNSSFSIQQQIRQGVRIALIGSVNVGKSSLLIGALIGVAAHVWKVQPMMVVSGMLMPLESIAPFIIGGLATRFIEDQERFTPLWSGMFIAGSLAMILYALSACAISV